MVNQGDIIKVEGIKYNLLVVSKDVMNELDYCIVVPFSKGFKENAVHISTSFSSKELLLTEQVRYVDLNSRFYKTIGRVSLDEMVNIIDIIQGLFDFY